VNHRGCFGPPQPRICRQRSCGIAFQTLLLSRAVIPGEYFQSRFLALDFCSFATNLHTFIILVCYGIFHALSTASFFLLSAAYRSQRCATYQLSLP
jgi:hypothetical protein